MSRFRDSGGIGPDRCLINRSRTRLRHNHAPRGRSRLGSGRNGRRSGLWRLGLHSRHGRSGSLFRSGYGCNRNRRMSGRRRGLGNRECGRLSSGCHRSCRCQRGGCWSHRRRSRLGRRNRPFRGAGGFFARRGRNRRLYYDDLMRRCTGTGNRGASRRFGHNRASRRTRCNCGRRRHNGRSLARCGNDFARLRTRSNCGFGNLGRLCRTRWSLGSRCSWRLRLLR